MLYIHIQNKIHTEGLAKSQVLQISQSLRGFKARYYNFNSKQSAVLSHFKQWLEFWKDGSTLILCEHQILEEGPTLFPYLCLFYTAGSKQFYFAHHSWFRSCSGVSNSIISV